MDDHFVRRLIYKTLKRCLVLKMFTDRQYVFVAEIDLYNMDLCLHADSYFLKLLTIGCSVAIDGIWLTVREITKEYCAFRIPPEAIGKHLIDNRGEMLSERKVNVKFPVSAS